MAEQTEMQVAWAWWRSLSINDWKALIAEHAPGWQLYLVDRYNSTTMLDIYRKEKAKQVQL